MSAPGRSRRSDPPQPPAAELAATLEAYPDPVAIVRPLRGRAGAVRDAEIVAANAAYRAIADDPPAVVPVAGATLGTVRPDHLAAIRDVLDGADGTPATVRREMERSTPTGATVRTELTLVPAGEAVALIARDVTAQHAAAAELAAAERRARTSARRLAILAEHATDALAMITPAGIVTWASGATTAMLGLTEGDDLWTAWRDLVHREDAPAFEGVGDRFRAGAQVTETVRLRTMASGYRWFRIRFVPLAAGDDRFASLVASMQDVDELEQARQALERSEERFRLAMRASAVGMAITDSDGRSLEVNPALCTLLGREEAALRASGWQGLTHPDDLATDEALRADFLEGGREAARFRKRYLRPDGRIVWADVAVAAIREPDGAVRSFITQMVDVTAAQEAEARTARHRRELAEAQRIAHAGSWTLDVATGEWSWSDEMYRIFGFDPAGPLPDPERAEAGIAPDVRAALVGARHRATTSGVGWSMEYELRRPDGSVRQLISTGEAVRDASGAVVTLRGTIIDITERRRAREARIRRLEHQLDHVARVEHTMRTRIAVVNGWVEILGDLDGTTPLAGCHDALDAIARNGRELEGLLTGMLDAARATSRAEVMELAPVDVTRIVGEIVRDYAALHDGVHLRSDLRPGVLAVGFPEGIDTVVRHLVENSIRHGGSGVTVTVAARPLPDGRVELTITDDGPGFPPDEDVFAAFGRRKGGPGHGLGMHVVRTLVEAMGGEVAAGSGPDGRGAQVVVRLEGAGSA